MTAGVRSRRRYYGNDDCLPCVHNRGLTYGLSIHIQTTVSQWNYPTR